MYLDLFVLIMSSWYGGELVRVQRCSVWDIFITLNVRVATEAYQGTVD